MQLNKENLPHISPSATLSLPQPGEWELPEKVLQFGTGVLLRGLPDYYINKANRQHLFNGRIVVVKSTGGSAADFAAQDGLYTHCIKGLQEGKVVETYTVNAAISRVLHAAHEWQAVLDCATNRQLQIIISNTTEVGIALNEEDKLTDAPPQSFPGKLLAFLHARYRAFGGSPQSGMVIIPTELIVDNGSKLKDIVLQLAHIQQLDAAFINWLLTANDFCSSLVDRIVPGGLPPADKQALTALVGYEDELAIMSEPYSLWAIETHSARTRDILSFVKADGNVVIAENIYKFRELKLRLLNGTHTFSCGLAFLCGFEVVNAAMQDAAFQRFLRQLMLDEAAPCVVNKNIDVDAAASFAEGVISRFSNPFIQHKWWSITLQYSGKIKQRCVPLIVRYYALFGQPPAHMALGFAAYLLFMKATSVEEGKYYGERNGERYWIQDDKAAYFYTLWQHNSAEKVVAEALTNTALWGENLGALPHFADAVTTNVLALMNGAVLESLLSPQGGDNNR